jgi:NAD-dependent dihydropyrimidine dehydrogenase PreA subunit
MRGFREMALNKTKARAAANTKGRPGEDCGAAPGRYRPHVNRSKCEGKSDCVQVCPYDVFEVRVIDARDFAELSLLGKLRSVMHGRKTAYTPEADACQACGLCVVACPEKAITLQLSANHHPE